MGIVGAIVLIGLIISGGMIPNANPNSGDSELQSSSSRTPASDFGSIEGYVSGPTGLPAIGASVIAYKQTGLIDSFFR
jgi:hypothetical protein